MISVAIVDDHQLVRSGMKALFAEDKEIEITAEYGDAQQVLNDLSTLSGSIDVIMLDIMLPDMNGMELLKHLVGIDDPPAVILLTSFPEDEYATQAIKDGAKGYLTKDSDHQVIREAILAVSHGGLYISSRITSMLFGELEEVQQNDSLLDQLSPQELQVCNHLCSGLSIKEIAFEMNLSSKSVSTYKRRLFEKLHADNLADLIKITMNHPRE